MIRWIITLPHEFRRIVLFCSDTMLLITSIWASYCLRLDYLYIPDNRVISAGIITLMITLFFFSRTGIYQTVLRFYEYKTFNIIITGAAISSLSFITLCFLFQAYLPRSIPLIYFSIVIITIGGSRFLARLALVSNSDQNKIKVAIYGAGTSGRLLATALMQGKEQLPVAFLDDNPSIKGMIIQGLKVYRPHYLRHLMSQEQVSQVFVAVDNMTTPQRSKIITFLSSHAVEIKLIPSFADILSGKADITEVKEIASTELLERTTVTPDLQSLEKSIQERRILVTGAGGSIGSELCRQIQQMKPKLLVLYEISEYALYKIETELLDNNPHDVTIKSILGNTQSQHEVAQTLTRYSIQTIYHAAAYKHVHLVERNPIPSILNNIFGTAAMVNAAADAKVEKFVMISTDKAVHPTSFMGATKRFAELIVRGAASAENCHTEFSIVRFGNVLGSSGSVVPLFMDQIQQGGPITVTHPEVTRFFMTISEAVQLVLQSCTLSARGDIFVLNMGKPVQILSLAHNITNLMGKTIKSETNPSGEVEIVFTGLRPGEKLHEQLLLTDDSEGTNHPMITRAIEKHLSPPSIVEALTRLNSPVRNRDLGAILDIITTVVDTYSPDPKFMQSLAKQQQKSNNVTPLINS